MFAVGSFSAPATRLIELSNCIAAFAAYPPTAASGAVMPAVMESPTSAMARPALCMRAPISSAAVDASANLFAMADAPPIAAIFLSKFLRAASAFFIPLSLKTLVSVRRTVLLLPIYSLLSRSAA